MMIADTAPDFKGICLAVIPTGGPRRPRPFRRCGACATKPWPCCRQLSAVAEQLTIGKLVEAIGLDLARHSRS
jgi:hypothetical protein